MAGNDAATLLMVAGISTWTPRRSVTVRVVAADCSVVLEDVDWVVVVPGEGDAHEGGEATQKCHFHPFVRRDAWNVAGPRR